jgi:hypothetical protein
MGEEPDWSPDDLSEADGDGEEDYKELGGDATVTNEVERTRSAAAEEEVCCECGCEAVGGRGIGTHVLRCACCVK